MNVEVTDSSSQFATLREAWIDLTAQCSSPSLYATYDYNRIAWEHFSTAKDRLCILRLYDGQTLRAIAPFCITRQQLRGIPVRTIAFIAAWEGDKPSIVAPAGEEAAWDAIHSFLTTQFHSWDVLKVVEQPRDSVLCTRGAFLNDRRYSCQVSHDSTSYFIDLTGTWDAYFAARGSSVRKRLRKRARMLEELPDGVSVETISQPQRVTEALARVAALEKMSWKGDQGIGIHGDGPLRRFCEDFTHWAAEHNRVAIHFLKLGEKDIAAYLNYMYRDVVYARHTAYDPAYASYAPGIHLKAHIVRTLFGTEFREFDELGMHPSEGQPLFKVEWASGTRETRQLLVLRKTLKLLPIVYGRTIKAFVQKRMPARGE